MANNISIQPMSETDVPEVIQIGLTTKQLQIDDAEDMYYSAESMTKATRSNAELLLVAKDGDTLAGFFMAHINEIFVEVYISDIALKPEYRGQGVGQMFMAKARELLSSRGIDWSWALVQEENENMQKFMEKQGYTKGKKFFFYYKPVGF